LFYLGKTPELLNFSAGRQNLLDACETVKLRTILTSRQFIEKGKMQPVIEALSTKSEIVYLEDVRAAGIGFIGKLAALAAYMLKKRAKPANGEVILFTSGSENKPKGVVLTHENLYANMQQLR
jgi:acyl-[acyl-carrier-protein]-phospholipid O-acyltransferase/long-chain-fatty-acid--[acyl-carrier-protein] ligase